MHMYNVATSDKSTTDEYAQLEKILISQLQSVLTEMPGTYVANYIVCNINSGT